MSRQFKGVQLGTWRLELWFWFGFVFFCLFSLKECFLVVLNLTHVFTEVWLAEFISQEDVLGVSGLPPLRLTRFYFSFETTEKLSMLHPKKDVV